MLIFFFIVYKKLLILKCVFIRGLMVNRYYIFFFEIDSRL